MHIENVLDKISTYKYKDDVQVLDGLTFKEKASLVACAYAMVHLPANDADLQPIAEALKCATPVITVETQTTQEYFGNIGILLAGFEHEPIGDALISLYKNEDQRSQMIENAKKQALAYNRDIIAKPFWELIEKLAKPQLALPKPN